jgi:hypothetical protein
MFLRGRQQQYIFGREDLFSLLSQVLAHQYVFFKYSVVREEYKIPITEFLAAKSAVEDKETGQLFIVPFDRINNVHWEKKTLNTGIVTYFFLPDVSQAVQLLYSKENDRRISVGRISVATQYKEDSTNEIITSTYGADTYKYMLKAIKKLSIGKLGVIYIGKNAYSKAVTKSKTLAYDLKNPDTYDVNLVRLF